ncbi:hypothetical protein LR48_Vigan50s000200 [Vigna angularis]|uniref:Uncharacterized protein n=1 Tax=Phaseolus angularis TaxID=3914 RepID=A0A0L9T3D7_PHAAN|nr:hypothetical protein LR48_Vigan50s000200 [Vigna angularis]
MCGNGRRTVLQRPNGSKDEIERSLKLNRIEDEHRPKPNDARMYDTYICMIHRGQVPTAEMIIGMYDTPPAHRWTMDEFHNVVVWLEEQAQASRVGVVGVLAMDDEDDEDVFEDAKDDEEEEDSDDSMG